MKNILQFDEFNEDGKHALCSWREKRKEKFQHAKSGRGCFVKGGHRRRRFQKLNPPDFQLNWYIYMRCRKNIFLFMNNRGVKNRKMRILV